MKRLLLQIGDANFFATLEENAAVEALLAWLEEGPQRLVLRDYAGFEKVGPLGRRLPAHDRQTHTAPGDIVLYSGDQLVLFYGPNSWRYTRIGRVEQLDGWKEALGRGDIAVTLCLAD